MEPALQFLLQLQQSVVGHCPVFRLLVVSLGSLGLVCSVFFQPVSRTSPMVEKRLANLIQSSPLQSLLVSKIVLLQHHKSVHGSRISRSSRARPLLRPSPLAHRSSSLTPELQLSSLLYQKCATLVTTPDLLSFARVVSPSPTLLLESWSTTTADLMLRPPRWARLV